MRGRLAGGCDAVLSRGRRSPALDNGVVGTAEGAGAAGGADVALGGAAVVAFGGSVDGALLIAPACVCGVAYGPGRIGSTLI